MHQFETDFAFRWIVGDMSICHDRLSRLRSEYRPELNALYTQVIGVLLFKELMSLELAGQDGMRVRANAGAASFRSERGLTNCEQLAALHLKAVLAQQEDPDLTPAQKARRPSATEDYKERVAEAKLHLASMPKPAEDKLAKPAEDKPAKPSAAAKSNDPTAASGKPAPAKRGPKPSKDKEEKKSVPLAEVLGAVSSGARRGERIARCWGEVAAAWLLDLRPLADAQAHRRRGLGRWSGEGATGKRGRAREEREESGEGPSARSRRSKSGISDARRRAPPDPPPARAPRSR